MNRQLSIGYLQAMADSDGSIGRAPPGPVIVQFGQTQREVIDLISYHLTSLGIEHKVYGPWQSSKPPAKPMYRLRIQRKNAVKRFMHLIGFRHPARAARAQALHNYWY